MILMIHSLRRVTVLMMLRTPPMNKFCWQPLPIVLELIVIYHSNRERIRLVTQHPQTLITVVDIYICIHHTMNHIPGHYCRYQIHAERREKTNDGRLQHFEVRDIHRQRLIHQLR
jgi:hypothetical protein